MQNLQINNFFFVYADSSFIAFCLYDKVLALWQHQSQVIVQVAGLALACSLKKEVVLTGDHNRYRLPLAAGQPGAARDGQRLAGSHRQP